MINWSIFLFIGLVAVLFIIIVFFIRLNNRNNEYYNIIHSDLLSVVPLKIDLKKEIIIFSDKLEVLNHKKRVSIFVFKSMINRRAKVELEILFQNLLINNFPFRPTNYSISFQLNNKVITYDLSLDYYDLENNIIYGQMQSNTQYNRFFISENIVLHPTQLTVAKTDFVQSILDFFATQKYNEKNKSQHEYMILIKIKNYSSLESLFTSNNIESMELLITYFAKSTLGTGNTIICKYYDGQFLIYSKNKKMNISTFQKKLNHYIKSNLVEKSSYLQIQTQFISATINIKSENSSVYALYNKIIGQTNWDSNERFDLIEIKLREKELKNSPDINHEQLLYSQEIKKLLTVNIAPVYMANDASEPSFYYTTLSVIKNDYYDDLSNLMRNIQDAGLWWKVYEPLFLKALDDFGKLKVEKDLVIPLLLMELENKTILTQILNIVAKKEHTLFQNCNLIFDFKDNSVSVINNWEKYENIISTLRQHNVKIAFSHELKNIDNFKLISHFKPDLVVLTPKLLGNITFNFNKFIKVIICLNYLNILGIEKIVALGISNVPEIILLKSLKINYLAGKIFETEQVNKVITALNYPSYWKWTKSQNAKGE